MYLATTQPRMLIIAQSAHICFPPLSPFACCYLNNTSYSSSPRVSHDWYLCARASLTCIVNGLVSYLGQHQLFSAESCPEILHDCGLGIDATHYIRELYTRESIKSGLASAVGGIPTAFRKEVESDLAKLKRWRTEPKFVFDGLDLMHLNTRDDKTWKTDPMIAKRKSAWDTWTKLAEKGRYTNAEGLQKLAQETQQAFEACILASVSS